MPSQEPIPLRVPQLSRSNFSQGKIYWSFIRTVARHVELSIPISELDLSNAIHVRPYIIALAVGACRRLKSEGFTVRWPTRSETRDHLLRIGTADVLGVETTQVGERQTNVPLRVLDEPAGDSFSWELTSMLEVEFSQELYAGLKQDIANTIDEMILNALTHSGSDCIVCAQAFPQTNRVEAVILDFGITIRGHLCKQFHEIKSDGEAIQRAMEEGVTGTVGLNRFGEPNSGEGLFRLKQHITDTRGELAILSGSALVCIGRDEPQPLFGQRFQGTLVNIKFNTAPG